MILGGRIVFHLFVFKVVFSTLQTLLVLRWYASSKTCGDCGTKNTKLKLSDREWVCESCGSVHDRDFNAACRIEEEGKRLARLLV